MAAPCDQISTESDETELGGDPSASPPRAAGQSFSEADEMELAADFLEVTNDAELDRFLADLIRKSARAAGGISPESGRALGAILKGALRKSLPVAGGRPGIPAWKGTDVGARGLAAARAGHLFGLELEGLSPEDQEFEVARRAVRFARSAAAGAARARASGDAQAIARKAAIAAAKRHAPGLLRNHPASSAAPRERCGRWLRQGRNVFVFNC